MGTVTFEGEAPFELALQRLPTARAEGESVLVILPVFVPGEPQDTLDIRVMMAIQHAEQLFAQLQPALTMANVNLRGGR
jgi:hypothetical protein